MVSKSDILTETGIDCHLPRYLMKFSLRMPSIDKVSPHVLEARSNEQRLNVG
jgi:hypothetical protein